MAKDSNGNKLYKWLAQEGELWGANVWFGSNPATEMRRYYYLTRKEAQRADISDANVVKVGPYGRPY